MARQRRTSQSSGGAASPDRDGSSPPHASGSRSVRGHAASSATSGTTVAAVTPTKCKRPMNAFMLFAKKFRVEYTQLYPGKDNRAISVILGDRWKKMRSEERRMYTLEAKALADQQKKINPDCWKRKRTNSQINDEATTKAHAVVARRSPKIRSNKKSGTKQDSAEIAKGHLMSSNPLPPLQSHTMPSGVAPRKARLGCSRRPQLCSWWWCAPVAVTRIESMPVKNPLSRSNAKWTGRRLKWSNELNI